MDITNVGSCQIYGHYEKGGRGEGEIEGEREREICKLARGSQGMMGGSEEIRDCNVILNLLVDRL
jgi:hypothetical protein